MVDVIQGIECYMDGHGIASVADLVGSVEDRDASDGLVFMETAP